LAQSGVLSSEARGVHDPAPHSALRAHRETVRPIRAFHGRCLRRGVRV